MSLASFRFFLTEALLSIRRAGSMTVVTILTIAIALALIGAFLVASINFEALLQRLQEEALVTVFFRPETDSGAVHAIQLQITAFDEIADVHLVTPEDAVRELFATQEDQELLQAGVGSVGNPLPFSVRLTPKQGIDLASLVAKLKALPHVDAVSYGEEAFRRFKGLTELAWIITLTVIILLGCASLFIVFNTIRLTLFLRRDEIIVLKLVGATNWFVRWPFIIEGSIHGLLAAVLAMVALYLGGNFLLTRLNIIPFFAFSISTPQMLKLGAKLFLMGPALGIAGSLLSLRDLNTISKSNFGK